MSHTRILPILWVLVQGLERFRIEPTLGGVLFLCRIRVSFHLKPVISFTVLKHHGMVAIIV